MRGTRKARRNPSVCRWQARYLEAELAWIVGRYALGATVLAGGLLALYRWLPYHHLPTWAVLPGVLLTLLLWLVSASLFSLYLGTVADYSLTYGSLAGVAITLLFFYLSGALFILGAEYNPVRLKGPSGNQP